MEKELTISGMSCQHCVHAVRQALSAIDDVDVKEVEIGRAVVVVPDEGDREASIREALDEEGFGLESAA